MNLSTEQQLAVERGQAVPVVVGQIECIVIRRDVYEQSSALVNDEIDPARFYSLVGQIMAEDDADDPTLESYQKYKQ